MREGWARTPAWVACCALSLLSGVVLAAISSSSNLSGAPVPALCLALALIVLRDAGLLLGLRLRGGTLASDAWCFVFCGCLHILGPLLLRRQQAPVLLAVFTVDPSYPPLGVPILIAEIAVVACWVRWQWQRQTQQAA